jgi:hypothetical protein
MQQTSKVTVKVDGDSIRSKAGSSSAKLGGLYRTETESTDQGTFVYKEKWIPSEIKTTVIHVADTDLIKIRDSKDVTVTYEPDVGKTLTMANAVCTEVGELKDGECEVTFQGDALKS